MKWLAAGVLLWAGAIALFPAHAQAIAKEGAGEESAAPPAVVTEGTGLGATEIPPLISTTTFSERPEFRMATLSPDGQIIVILRERLGAVEYVVVDAQKKQMVNTFRLPESKSPDRVRWVGNDRLLIHEGFRGRAVDWGQRYSRLVLVDPLTGHAAYLLDQEAGVNGGEIVYVSPDGDFVLLSHREDEDDDGPSVFRYAVDVELTTPAIYGTPAEIEPVKVQSFVKNVEFWVPDNSGAVRLGLGWKGKRLHVWYRGANKTEFERIGKFEQSEDDRFFEVAQLVRGTDVGFVLESFAGGRVGLHRYDFAAGEHVETVYENPDWDIEDVYFRDGVPVAVSYLDDRRQMVWFNEDDRATHAALQSALGDTEVWVSSQSDDGNSRLIWALSEADPGVLYLFDQKRQSLEEIAQARPGIDFQKLARPKPFQYTARDGTVIPAYLTLPKGRVAKDLPLIVLPHGGPFGIRDSLVYNDEVQFLANRGYAVIQPNFRGSGGYGDAYYDLGVGQVGRKMQDDVDDAMDWAVGQGIADPNRVCVVGGSYGGYAALWAVLRNPERYRCAASWAGVTHWDKILRYDRKFLTRKASRRWRNKIVGETRFDMDKVSPVEFGRRLNRPVLLAHGTYDPIVPFEQFVLFEKASAKAPMPPETLVLEWVGHSFSTASSQKAWLDALDSFLAKHNPADQVDEQGNLLAPKVDTLQRLLNPSKSDEDDKEAEAPLSGAES